MSTSPSVHTELQRRRRPAWWAWHQRLGLSCAVVFLGVIFTGIALNHTEGLALDERRLSAGWIYDWYAMNPEGEPVAYALDRCVVAWWGGSLYLDGRSLGAATALRGAVALPEVWLVASAAELWVLTPEGEVVEKLGPASLPAGEITGLGRGPGATPLRLRTSGGTFASAVDLLEWVPADAAGSVVDQIAMTPEQRAAILTAHRGEGISLYRLMLDLHSGRFFGRFGVWVADLAALALGFLTVSGVWYAWRVKRR